jgi:hypothetical protein
MSDDQQPYFPKLSLITTRAPAMVWSHQDKDTDRIYWSPNTSAIGGIPQWATPPQLPRDAPASSSTPSICGNQEPICMAWKGVSDDPVIWYSLWDTAAGTWGPQIASPFQTEHFPTVVHFRGHTLMFWNSSNPRWPHPEYHDNILWSELVNGEWVHPLGSGEHNVAKLGLPHVEGIAAAWNTHEDALYIAWRDVRHDNSGKEIISVSWWRLDNHTESGGFLWQENGTIPSAAASAPPALACDGNVLTAAWRNVENDHISWAWSVNGAAWFGPYSLTDRRTSSGPALAALGTSDIVMAWKGGGDDTRIWWSRCRDAVWGDQQAFTDRSVLANRRVSLWSPVL